VQGLLWGLTVRRSLLASTALTASTTLLAGAAWAADLPVKTPVAPPTPRVFSWTGCYIGANVGGASTSIRQSAVVPSVVGRPSSPYDFSGQGGSFTGGGQLGCNWQLNPNWVIGFESDINSLKANRNVIFGGENTIRGSQMTSLSWVGTFRGRFGYVWDRVFLYATGGLAFGKVDSSVSASDPPGFYAGSYSAVRAGWAAGGGVEYAFTDRISGKVEYLHFDLGNANYTVSNVTANSPASWITTAGVYGDIVRVGFNFKLFP
jgi:outer membrane immunogenic protein